MKRGKRKEGRKKGRKEGRKERRKITYSNYQDERQIIEDKETEKEKIQRRKTEDIQLTIDEMINSIEHLSIENSNARESLEIFMVLDQLHVKINELNADHMEQLIQDLVMANAGHVTPPSFSPNYCMRHQLGLPH